MCTECVKHQYPDRNSTCLDNGAYFLNFDCCAQCKAKDVLQVTNRQSETEEENGEEIVTYQHTCKECGHLIANHEYSFCVEGQFQVHAMDCMLCGTASDERSILPDDPRQETLF